MYGGIAVGDAVGPIGKNGTMLGLGSGAGWNTLGAGATGAIAVMKLVEVGTANGLGISGSPYR